MIFFLVFAEPLALTMMITFIFYLCYCEFYSIFFYFFFFKLCLLKKIKQKRRRVWIWMVSKKKKHHKSLVYDKFIILFFCANREKKLWIRASVIIDKIFVYKTMKENFHTLFTTSRSIFLFFVIFVLFFHFHDFTPHPKLAETKYLSCLPSCSSTPSYLTSIR